MIKLQSSSKATRVQSANPLKSAKKNTRPVSSNKITPIRPQTTTSSFKPKFLKTEHQTTSPSFQELDVLDLILKTTPDQYDINVLTEKKRKLEEMYSERMKYKDGFTKVDATFYRYNLLYGSKSNSLLRSYSPKMRPKTAGSKHIKCEIIVEEEKCFTPNDIRNLFLAKCTDLGIKIIDHLEQKFYEYCNSKCINRRVDLSDVYSL